VLPTAKKSLSSFGIVEELALRVLEIGKGINETVVMCFLGAIMTHGQKYISCTQLVCKNMTLPLEIGLRDF
jgi:hypothetical protein